MNKERDLSFLEEMPKWNRAAQKDTEKKSKAAYDALSEEEKQERKKEAGQKKVVAIEEGKKIRARDKAAEAAKWEALLAEEGMPDELPDEVQEALDQSGSTMDAVRAYMNTRYYTSNADAYGHGAEGQHRKVAKEISRMYGISTGQALRMIEQAAGEQAEKFTAKKKTG